MVTWHEDDSPNEIAIWLGRFSSNSDLSKFAVGRFRKELGLPETKYFEISSLEYAFADHEGPQGALGRLLWSESFLAPALREARRRKLRNANGAISVHSYFADDAESLDASRAAFLGYFPFDVGAPRAVISTPAYVNEQKVSIWAGYFSAKVKFEKYFSLDDQTRRTPNRLAVDFEIPSYETDFASWVTARQMVSRPIDELLKAFPLTMAFRKKIAAKAAGRKLLQATSIYMAYDVDYDEIGKATAGEKRCHGAVRYIGSFDSPSLESKMRIVRSRKRRQKLLKRPGPGTRKAN
jgi:hypothetical protein